MNSINCGPLRIAPSPQVQVVPRTALSTVPAGPAVTVPAFRPALTRFRRSRRRAVPPADANWALGRLPRLARPGWLPRR